MTCGCGSIYSFHKVDEEEMCFSCFTELAVYCPACNAVIKHGDMHKHVMTMCNGKLTLHASGMSEDVDVRDMPIDVATWLLTRYAQTGARERTRLEKQVIRVVESDYTSAEKKVTRT